MENLIDFAVNLWGFLSLGPIVLASSFTMLWSGESKTLVNVTRIFASVWAVFYVSLTISLWPELAQVYKLLQLGGGFWVGITFAFYSWVAITLIASAMIIVRFVRLSKKA